MEEGLYELRKYKNTLIDQKQTAVHLNKSFIEEDVADIGFNITTTNTSTKTFLVTSDVEGAKKLNSKQLEITFSYGTFTKEFIEEYVLFYLKQIIPSTTIFKIIYKPMDTVYGITINNQ